MSRAGLRARAVDFFIEPREPLAPDRSEGVGASYRDPAPPPRGEGVAAPFAAPAPVRHAAPVKGALGTSGSHIGGPITFAHGPRGVAAARARAATRLPFRAAVLGSAAEAPPVAALLANAQRLAAGAPAAAVAVWAPGAGTAPVRRPATLAAGRLAARLSARELPAAGRGRLAWLALDDHPVAAAVAARRAAGALEVPLVVVVAGPRCEVVEGLIGEQDLVVVVAEDPEGPLARLAVGSCAGAALVHAPVAPGPARWLALCGWSGGRGLGVPLRRLVADLGEAPAVLPEEPAW